MSFVASCSTESFPQHLRRTSELMLKIFVPYRFTMSRIADRSIKLVAKYLLSGNRPSKLSVSGMTRLAAFFKAILLPRPDMRSRLGQHSPVSSSFSVAALNEVDPENWTGS